MTCYRATSQTSKLVDAQVQQNRHSAWLFPGERKGFALNLDNVAARVIRLALGVAPEVVQTILGHGDAAGTRKHRILLKFQDGRRAAMTRLEKAVSEADS